MVEQSGKAVENRPEEAGISYEDKKQKLCGIMDAWAPTCLISFHFILRMGMRQISIVTPFSEKAY